MSPGRARPAQEAGPGVVRRVASTAGLLGDGYNGDNRHRGTSDALCKVFLGAVGMPASSSLGMAVDSVSPFGHGGVPLV